MMDSQFAAGLFAFCGATCGALVGALSAVYLHRKSAEENFQQREEKARQHRKDVFRLYADPLHSAVGSLRWRLKEIIEEPGRQIYLSTQAPHTPYHVYKYHGTVYRLVAVLGWIRAFRRERALLDPAQKPDNDKITDHIEALEKALADGAHIELQRLEEITALVGKGVSLPDDEKAQKDLAIGLENLMRSNLHGAGVSTPNDLEADGQACLVKDVCEYLAKKLHGDFPVELAQEHKQEVCKVLGIREANLYRDWQAALGDMVITDSRLSEGRRFDVMGFRDFEKQFNEVFQDDDHRDKAWITRVRELFDDLDVQRHGMFDARREQMRNIFAKLGELEAALSAKIETFRH